MNVLMKFIEPRIDRVCTFILLCGSSKHSQYVDLEYEYERDKKIHQCGECGEIIGITFDGQFRTKLIRLHQIKKVFDVAID